MAACGVREGAGALLSSAGGGQEVDAAERARGLAQAGGHQGPGVSGLNARVAVCERVSPAAEFAAESPGVPRPGPVTLTLYSQGLQKHPPSRGCLGLGSTSWGRGAQALICFIQGLWKKVTLDQEFLSQQNLKTSDLSRRTTSVLPGHGQPAVGRAGTL